MFKIHTAKPVDCLQAKTHFNCHTKCRQILTDKQRLMLKFQDCSAKKSADKWSFLLSVVPLLFSVLLCRKTLPKGLEGSLGQARQSWGKSSSNQEAAHTAYLWK